MKSFQLRGTNGSGKTHVARHLLKISQAEPDVVVSSKVKSYAGSLEDRPFFVLGSYETVCGGCDTISSVKEVAELFHYYMCRPDDAVLFFEGLMISHMLGTVGQAQKERGLENSVLAFLDTPLETCLDRVRQRRLARGDTRPFSGQNVIADHPRVFQSRDNALKQGYRVVDINHLNAVEEVLCHLKKL